MAEDVRRSIFLRDYSLGEGGGELPMMAYTGRLRPKGVPFSSLLAGGYWGFHCGKPVPFGNRAPSWIFEARAPRYERASAKIEGGGGKRLYIPAPSPRSLCELSTRPRPSRANSRWRPHYEFRFFSAIQSPACRLTFFRLQVYKRVGKSIM